MVNPDLNIFINLLDKRYKRFNKDESQIGFFYLLSIFHEKFEQIELIMKHF